MRPITWRLLCTAASVLVVLALVALIATAPKHPAALMRVVDATGMPVGGAIVSALVIELGVSRSFGYVLSFVSVLRADGSGE